MFKSDIMALFPNGAYAHGVQTVNRSYAVKVNGRIVLRTHSPSRAEQVAQERGGKVIRDPRTITR